MKKFFAEFKKFITRGNVVDMAVGVIVGSSFTAIVNGLSNFILKPLTNWLLAIIFGKDTLTELYTMLKPAYVLDDAGNATAEIDLAKSIYIDWGSFINAIINFFLIAFVLFVIVKVINRFREDQKDFKKKVKRYHFTYREKKELKANGINKKDRAAALAYFDNKKKLEEEAAKEKERLKREANPTTEDLLKLILAELKNKD